MREQPPFQVRDRNKCVYCHKSLNVSDVVSFNQLKKYNKTYKEAPEGRAGHRARSLFPKPGENRDHGDDN